MASSATTMDSISYLSQTESIAVDEELMGPLGFSVDQLMELAGLSVATSLASEYPSERFKRVLVIAGPGNNGGDGLVAARHLHHFGYQVQIVYPKPTDKPLYKGLVTQAHALKLPMLSWVDVQAAGPLAQQYDVVLDAIFGFSFKGDPRPPFDEILKALSPSNAPPPIVSVDAPSGWGIEEGPRKMGDIEPLAPDMLVSLTAPKQCAQYFKGRYHYLGGRFVPPAIRDKYKLTLPPFPGTAQHVRLPPFHADKPAEAQSAPPGEDTVQVLGSKASEMRINYTRGGLLESDMAQWQDDPMRAWAEWFRVATELKVCEEPNAISLASADAQGRPSVRVVLLKGFDTRGFVFYSNYNSRKGKELLGNGYAAFSVYWEQLQRQVRVEGTVEKLSEEESSEYFHSRPHGSQLGAWVSQQSEVMHNGREELEARQKELEAKYPEGTPVPKPPHWGGFLVRPTAIEFWQGRPSRLHDRIRFIRPNTNSTWTMERQQP